MAGREPQPVRVGTCGFRGRQADTFTDLDLVEIQQSFYQPPRLATAARWRARAPAAFAFTLKAWQLVTHAASSPTYRRLRESLSPTDRELAGGLRWNRVTRRAWDRTRAVADCLRAEAIVLQTPRSFRPTAANLRRLERFFARIERDGRWIVFEPRGPAWDAGEPAALLRSLGIVRGVDPFLADPPAAGLQYLRLHGRPAYNYHHAYSDAELTTLCGLLDRQRPARVLFNNDHMDVDARRFRRRLRAGGRPSPGNRADGFC